MAGAVSVLNSYEITLEFFVTMYIIICMYLEATAVEVKAIKRTPKIV